MYNQICSQPAAATRCEDTANKACFQSSPKGVQVAAAATVYAWSARLAAKAKASDIPPDPFPACTSDAK